MWSCPFDIINDKSDYDGDGNKYESIFEILIVALEEQ